MEEEKKGKAHDLTHEAIVLSGLPDTSPYGLSKGYDRKLYDCPKAHKEFHDSQFR